MQSMLPLLYFFYLEHSQCIKQCIANEKAKKNLAMSFVSRTLK